MSKLYENEIWKPVVDYEGLYEISNYGRLRSYYKKNGRGIIDDKGYLMKIKSDKAGYQVVGLTKNSKQTVLKVHRLVAEAFLEDFNEADKLGYHVDHIDENKRNNNVSNLQMLSHFDNCYKRTGYNAFQLLKAIHLNTGKEYIFEGQNEAARELNLNQGNINNVLSGRIHQTGGFTFIRLNKEEIV